MNVDFFAISAIPQNPTFYPANPQETGTFPGTLLANPSLQGLRSGSSHKLLNKLLRARLRLALGRGANLFCYSLIGFLRLYQHLLFRG